MKRLYKFSFDFGRGYKGLGLFWEEPEKVKKLIGKTISFGEICGKHSEVDVDITEKMIEDVTDKIQDENFYLGLQPQAYLPKFDEMRLENGCTIELENIVEPEEIDFDTEFYWQKAFYTWDDKQYKVVRKEIIEDKVIYYAEKVEND